MRDVADVELFHRRHADDGGGVNGILSMRDGGDVGDGIRLGTVATTPARCELFLNQQHVVALGVADQRAFCESSFVLRHHNHAGRNEMHVRIA